MKFKTAIVIIGKPNSGKTSSLREFAKDVIAQKGVELIKPHACPVSLKRPKGDFTLVVKINGVVIGMASCGDDERKVVRALEIFEECNCEVVVFAVSLPAREGAKKQLVHTISEREVSLRPIL